ncbi:hypothetical protein LTR53_017276, partial [Teratosphaeriaceae sp. CCFEE 6253]
MAAFKDWARAEGLEDHANISVLRNCRIAFDAEDYLDNLLTATLSREPLLPALGGLPFALQKHVDDDLRRFHEARIKPRFVFNGLQGASKHGAMVGREAKRAAKILDDAWSIYDQGRGEDAVNAFGKACTYKTEHISRWLFAHLHKAGIRSLMTAPQTAASQLVYNLQEEYCEGVAGSAALLVAGAEKVITNFNWETSRFSLVESAACQGKLMFTAASFTDLMLLSGCVPALLPPYPYPLADSETPRIQALRAALTQVGGDGHTFLLREQAVHKDPEYLDAFEKARASLKFALFTDETGVTKTRNAEQAPGDMHSFIGRRLPEELYKYLLHGICGPRVLEWSAHRLILENPPLDGGNSPAYQDLVQTKLVDLRVKALAVIAVHLNRYYQNADMTQAVWWSSDRKNVKSATKDAMENASSVQAKWHVPESVLPTEVLQRPLTAALGLLVDEKIAKATVTERSGPGVLSTPVELLGNATLRFLQDAGYVKADHTLSAWGKAVQAALLQAQSNGYMASGVDETEAEEAIFLAFELLKLKVLNSQHMFPTPPYSGPPLRGTDSDKANTLLISRVACLGLFRHREIGYTGPLSRHLLAYHQMTAAVRASLRDLVEMHATAMLLSGSVSRRATIREVGHKLLADLGVSLPFMREPDLGLALVVKSYLDEMSNEPAKRQDITRWFNYVLDMEGDLQKAWKMWGCINTGVQAAETSIIPEQTKK